MTTPRRLPTSDSSLSDHVREAATLLEELEAHRSRLAGIPLEERRRLHRAVAQLHNPDPVDEELCGLPICAHALHSGDPHSTHPSAVCFMCGRQHKEQSAGWRGEL